MAITPKYHNRRIRNEYGLWDSKKEYLRYLCLLKKLRNGEITELHRQVKFTLIPAQYETVTVRLKTKTKEKRVCLEKECSYRADFTYMENGHLVVEDVKSEITRKNAEYVIKKKLMLYTHKVRIREF